MKKIEKKLFRIMGIAMVVLLGLGLLPKTVYAINMRDLSAGGSITVGDKLFSDWAFFALTSENQLRSIDVGPNSTGNGLFYDACVGCLATTNTGKQLHFAYTVTVLDPVFEITDTSLKLVDFGFEGAGESGFISISEEIIHTTGPIGQLNVGVAGDGDPNTIDDMLKIPGLNGMRIFTYIDLAILEDSGDLARLTSFQQTFTQRPVSEPATLLFLIFGLIGIVTFEKKKYL